MDVQLHSIPRDTLKLVNTVATILSARGREPSRHVAVVRDWRSAVILVSRDPLGDAATTRLRDWARDNSFDAVVLPGLDPAETNRYHHREPGYHEPVKAILSGHAAADRYLFDITPATADRPFFFRFFRWQSLPQWLETTGSLWRQHLDWGYLLGLGTLLAGVALATALLMLPALATHRRPPARAAAPAYFLAIGLGFMFVEIDMLHKATLLLDDTAVSMGAVLTAMLAGAGFGSLWQQRWQPTAGARWLLFTLLILLILCAVPALELLFRLAADWPLALRLSAVILLIAAISVPLGAPLPLALRRLQAAPRATIAWAWAVNGFASVLGTLAAGLIAAHAGFTLLMLCAGACYLAAAVLLTLPPLTHGSGTGAGPRSSPAP